jgi:acyl carrier protein
MKHVRSEELGPLLTAVLHRNLQSERAGDELLESLELVALGLNSVSAINLLLDIEETFGVTFPASMLNEDTFRSVGSLRHALETLHREETVGRS